MDPGLTTYSIRIKGQLGAAVLSAFPALRSRHEGTETVLIGDLDQAALYGVLAEIEALGLDLIEIRQPPPTRNQPDPWTAAHPVDPTSGRARCRARSRAKGMHP